MKTTIHYLHVAALVYDLSSVLDWLDINQLVANPDKFQVMFLGSRNNPNIVIRSRGINLAASDKLHGVCIDRKLKFNLPIKSICTYVNKKINCLY